MYFLYRIGLFICIVSLLCNCDQQNVFQAEHISQIQYRGAVLAHVHRKGLGYGSGSSRRTRTELHQLGMNSIQYNVFAYQKDHKSTQLSWQDPSLTANDLRKEIGQAHSEGFHVFLKPHVWVGGARPIYFRNAIDFKDRQRRKEWFKSYTNFIMYWARLARDQKVAAFAIGTELVGLSKYSQEWRTLIAAVRNIGYKGQLLYACEAWNAHNIHFWNDLDAIGLDFYYGYAESEPELSELRAYYTDLLQKHTQHAASQEKPLWLTELGFPAHALAIKQPHSWPQKNQTPRPELQLLAYRAMMQAIQTQNQIEGFWLWKYATELQSYEKPNQQTGFILNSKPIQDHIKVWNREMRTSLRPGH